MQEYLDFFARHWMLTVAAVALLVLLLGNEFGRAFRKYRDLSPAEAARLVGDENVLLIDVREPDEYRSGYIKGARHIPLGSLAGKVDELASHKDKQVLLYCRSGNRSASAANILVKAGFSNVGHLAGGITAWQSDNYPVTKK